MNVEKVIKECHKDVANITLRTLSAIRQIPTNKQPIKMEKSTPKPREKKQTKIDVAIASLKLSYDNAQVDYDLCKKDLADIVTKMNTIKHSINVLEMVKNNTDLI
jgi:hypothetical protein